LALLKVFAQAKDGQLVVDGGSEDKEIATQFIAAPALSMA
jgi:hypothetical protein